MKLPRYAGKEFAVDCLTTGLIIDQAPGPHSGLPVNVSYYDFKAGNIVCKHATSVRSGTILAAILVLLHALLIILPLAFTVHFYKKAGRRKNPVRSLGHIMAAMGALSVSSFGEISQHIHDNWLYIGLYNSYNNTVFHAMLCIGQALLSWGVGGFSVRVIFDLGFCALSTVALIWGTMKTDDEKNPTVFCVAERDIGVQRIVWPIVFVMLTFTTASFIKKCYQSNAWTKPPYVNHRRYAILVVLFYAAGIVSTALLGRSGNQWFHITTAGSFIVGYICQASWIFDIQEREFRVPKGNKVN